MLILGCCAVCLSAQTTPIETAALSALASDDPVLRGEGALTLAVLGKEDAFEMILQVAKDPAPDAAQRAIIALGLLGTPGVEIRLGELLDGSRTRPRPEGIAAAFAVGLLPETHPGIAVEQVLARFHRSSYARQRELLIALLCGLQREPHPNKTVALQRLLRDDSNKDPVLRALLVAALGALPNGLDEEDIGELLREPHAVVRAVALEVMTRRLAALDLRPQYRTVEQLAARDRDPVVRARALAMLTAARHLPALELGAAAVTSRHPVEAAQGARTAITLGGGAMRRAVEAHVLELRKANLQAAILSAYPGRPTARGVAGCLEIARNRHKPFALRAAAALVAARAEGGAPRALLMHLFLEAGEAKTATRLARVLIARDPTQAIEDLLPSQGGEDLVRYPIRLQALLEAGHPGAGKALEESLQDAGLSDDRKAEMLVSWRNAQGPALPDRALRHLPKLLRNLW